ncbi:MAG: OmpH family outer membrane protein [Paludibacteraceae bacterium]|nr:OmpH family outer membrane protein [Candidatus Colicola equi]MCQ2340387.1 OmpH family outer membrane protein [Paludibacteraceae bacterium]
MKKLFIILAVAMPMLVCAQKVGHINTAELFQQMPEVNQVKQQIDSLSAQYETMLSSMQEEYKKKLEDYQKNQSTMTDAMRQIQEEDLYTMQQRIQTAYQTAEQDIQKKQQELLAPIHEKLTKAIQTVGEKEGYTYIYDAQALLYIAKDAHDVMAPVKAELGLK